MQRLADYKQAVYIPPSAKPSLQVKDGTVFPLMEKVQDFLAGDGQVMLVLGDSGAGKSSFNRHLEHQLWQKYKADGPIPLFINLPALDRPDKELVTEHLRRLDFPDELIWAMKQTRRFVLICDGYDESQLTCNLHTTNLLNQSGQWKAKLVVTCRTQYLGQDYQDQFVPKVAHQYHRIDNLLHTAVITPFSKDQLEEYVEGYIPLEPRTWFKEDYMGKLTAIPGLMELVKNPFLLFLCLESLPSVVEGKSDYSRLRVSRVQLYDIFVQHWLGVNKRRLQDQKLSKDDQAAFVELKDDGFEQSAIEFQMGLAAAIFTHQDGKPIIEYTPRKDKNSWKAEFFNSETRRTLLRLTCLLSRAGNQYNFVHRSVLEYFYSCTICPPPTCSDRFAPHIPSDSTDALTSISDHPLSKRSLVTEPSIVRFLAERVQTVPEFKQQLHTLLEESKKGEHASQAAVNAITILIKAGVRFNGADFRGVRIPGADLSGGQFDSAQFQDADLTGVNLANCWIRQVDFTNARMGGVQFGELLYLEEEYSPYTCVYSPDGSTFAVGLNNGDISIYDTTTWTRIRKLQGHTSRIFSLAFSPSSLQLLSGSSGTTVQLWNIETGLSENILKTDSTHARAVAFSPCGNQVAFASDSEFVILWDIHTRTAKFVLVTGSVCGVAYSPDGERIATGGRDGFVRIFDTQTGLLMWDLEGRHTSMRCIAYSPNGQWIITGYLTGELELWDMNTGELGPIWIGHNDSVTGIDFSPNGKWIASTSFDRTVKLWDVETKTLVLMFAGHSEGICSVAFSPDGSQVASGSWGDIVRLWEVNFSATGLDSHDSFASVSTVVYSQDGRHLVSGSMDGPIRQYNADTGEQEVTFSCGLYRASCFAYSPDGLYIVTAEDNDITIWDTSTGFPLVVIGGDKVVYAVAYSPCGSWIATGNNTTVALWEVESGEQIHAFTGHSDRINSVSFSPCGRQIASGSEDGTVGIWELSTGEFKQLVSEGQCWVGTVAYSLLGKQIASCHGDECVRIWDVQTSKLRCTLMNNATVECFALSSCGQWIATCYDSHVELWNCVSIDSSRSNSNNSNDNNSPEEWRRKALIQGLVGGAAFIAWRPGTLEFATGSMDGSTRVWRLQTEPKILVEQVWGIGPAALIATDALFEGAVDLSLVNRRLLTQRSKNGRDLLGGVGVTPDGRMDRSPLEISSTEE
jgi:WD40 repeat protein